MFALQLLYISSIPMHVRIRICMEDFGGIKIILVNEFNIALINNFLEVQNK